MANFLSELDQKHETKSVFNYKEFEAIYSKIGDSFWDDPKLGSKMAFLSAVEQYKNGASDIHTIGAIIAILQNFIFCVTNTNVDEEIQKLKENAGMEVCSIMKRLIDDKYLSIIVHIVMAQNYFVSGNTQNAIYHWEKAIEFPNLNSYDPDLSYIGELNTLVKIVHNLCVVYLITGQKEKADNLQIKYRYAYDMEREWTEKFVRNHPELGECANNEFTKLDDYPNVNTLYLYTMLTSSTLVGDMLYAISTDANRNGYIDCPTMDGYCNLQIQSDKQLAVFDSTLNEELFRIKLDENRGSKMLENTVLESKKDISVVFLSKKYTFPGYLCDYASYLNTFYEIQARLIKILNDQIKSKTFGCNSPEEDVFREAMESEGQAIIAALSEKGIFNVTMGELVRNTEGYKSIRTVCQKTLDEIISVMQRALNDFYNGYVSASQSASSQITGSGISIWTNSVSSMLLYSAMEASTIRKQCNQAEREYSKQIDALCRQNDDQIEREQTQVLVSIYYPGIAQAINLFCSELLQNYLKILERNNLFDCSITTKYDSQRSADLLKNLVIVPNKEQVIREAFIACPYNPDVYMALIDHGMGDIDTFKTAKYFHQEELLFESITQYCKNNKAKNTEISISALAILSKKSEAEVLRTIYAAELSSILENYQSFNKATSNKQELDKWIRKNIAETTSEIVTFDEEMIRSKISTFFDEIKSGECYKMLLKNNLIQSVDDIMNESCDLLVREIMEYINEAIRRKSAYDEAIKANAEAIRQGETKLEQLEAELKNTSVFAFSKKREIKLEIETIKKSIDALDGDAGIDTLKCAFVDMYL